MTWLALAVLVAPFATTLLTLVVGQRSGRAAVPDG